MRALIAFGGKPRAPSAFMASLQQVAEGDGVKILGGILTDGPGCSNVAIIVDANGDEENFVNQLTIALMPAKWEVCHDPRLVEGEFIVEMQP